MEESRQLMSQREIQILKDVDELSRAAADLFIELGRKSLAAHGAFSVSLAGGSTPRHLYSLLASTSYSSKLDWDSVVFFFGDERHVPPDSDQSNYRMANETLLGPLEISSDHVHRWRSESQNADEAAEAYAHDLNEYFDRVARPIDLVLLGLGEDGHTASLFPHTAALHELGRPAVANWVEKLDAYRLTMTFPFINSAANVIFIVAGAGKAAAVKGVLEGEFRPDDLPAQLVNPESGALFWLLDEGAASKLNRESYKR